MAGGVHAARILSYTNFFAVRICHKGAKLPYSCRRIATQPPVICNFSNASILSFAAKFITLRQARRLYATADSARRTFLAMNRPWIAQ
jgi:hypothetical protein